MEQCLASVCLRLVQRVTERQRWDEVLLLVQLVHNKSYALRLSVTALESLADCNLQALLRTGKLREAAELLEDAAAAVDEEDGGGEEAGAAPSADTKPVAATRAPLLQQLYDLATSSRDPSRVLLREACTALAALFKLKEKDMDNTAQLNEADLNRQYNDLLTSCCQRRTLEALRLGLDIIPSAHKNMLVINATVLRTLLLACYEHKQRSDQMHFLDLGMQVGIYPSIEIGRGPKSLALPTDLSVEEIFTIIMTMFKRMKAHLVELLSASSANNPPDVLEECDLTLTALSVGERDRSFVTARQLDATETGLLARLGQVLATPGTFYCAMQAQPVVAAGGARALRLNANSVYQCVYYLEEE